MMGCASYQPGSEVKISKGEHPRNVPISAYVDNDMSTDEFTVLQFVWGNKNKDWVRIKNVRLDLDNKELKKSINILVGEDLRTWADSLSHKLKVDNFNRQMFMNSLALIGTATMVAGGAKGNQDMAVGGAALTSAVIGIDAINKVMDEINHIERAALIPYTHLYNPFSVPPGLYTKKWIVLEAYEDEIPEKLYFDVEYLDGRKVRYNVILNATHKL